MAVSWREDGNILCSTLRHGVQIRSGDDLKLIKSINITGLVWSAYSVGDKLITKVHKDNKYSTYIGTESNPHHTLLHQYEGDYYSQLSVSDSIIADIDRANEQLMIYTITGNHLYNINISDMCYPDGVRILPGDHSVLVSDCGGEVRKYKLQAGTHQTVWTCSLSNPRGITSDQSGLIYVVSREEKKIYQISSTGDYIIISLLGFSVGSIQW